MRMQGSRRPKDGQAKTKRAQAARYDLAHTGRAVGDHRAGPARILAAQEGGSAYRELAYRVGGDHLPDAVRVSVGSVAQGIWLEEHRSRLVSALEQGRCHGADLGNARRELSGTWWRSLEMAKCRRSDGQGAFWGDCV